MDTPTPPAAKRSCRIWFIVPGILVFALLMAVRYEFSSVWLRAIIAGVAFLVLGGTLWVARRST